MIRLIQPAEVDYVWPMVAASFENACRKARSTMSAAELYRACRSGGWFLVVVTGGESVRGAAVLDIQERDKRTLKVIALAGEDSDDWLPSLLAWDWLDTMRIERVVAEGRAGLPRLLKKHIPELRVIRAVFEWDRTDAR